MANDDNCTMGQKSSIYPKIHILKILFLTKFTFWKSQFWQNSHFEKFNFHKIHIFKEWFFTKFTFSKCDCSQKFLFSKCDFSQNSHCQIVNFHKIHIFQTSKPREYQDWKKFVSAPMWYGSPMLAAAFSAAAAPIAYLCSRCSQSWVTCFSKAGEAIWGTAWPRASSSPPPLRLSRVVVEPEEREASTPPPYAAKLRSQSRSPLSLFCTKLVVITTVNWTSKRPDFTNFCTMAKVEVL